MNQWSGGQHPHISIIIATYNAEAYLNRCLNSILAQSYKNTEVIIVDGGSSDNTLNIIRQYSSFITKWISEPDKGIYDALNKGIGLARGKWIYFLGADDILLEGFSSMAKELKDIHTLYYGYCMQGGQNMGTSYTKYQLAKRNVCHHAVFYPSKVFLKYTYQTEYKVFADYLLNIQCWGDADIKKKYLPVLIASFESGGFSMKHEDRLFKQHKPDYIKKHLGRLVWLRYLLKRKKEMKKNPSFF